MLLQSFSSDVRRIYMWHLKCGVNPALYKILEWLIDRVTLPCASKHHTSVMNTSISHTMLSNWFFLLNTSPLGFLLTQSDSTSTPSLTSGGLISSMSGSSKIFLPSTPVQLSTSNPCCSMSLPNPYSQWHMFYSRRIPHCITHLFKFCQFFEVLKLKSKSSSWKMVVIMFVSEVDQND